MSDFALTSVRGRELAQRASLMGAMLEDVEVRWIKGEQVTLVEYGTLVNAQRRVMHDIGLESRQPDDAIDTPELVRVIIDVLNEAGLDTSSLETLNKDSAAPGTLPQAEGGGGAGVRGDCMNRGHSFNFFEHPENGLSKNYPESSEKQVTQKFDEPKVGDCHAVGGRGAQIIYVEISGTSRRKWEIIDGFGVQHGYRIARDAAEKLALELNGPDLELKPGPESGKDREG